MKSVTSLFVMSLLAVPQAGAFVSYKSASKAYRIEKTKKALVLHEGGLELELPLQKCSEAVTDSLMKEISRHAAELPEVKGKPKKITGPDIQFSGRKLAALNVGPGMMDSGSYFRNLPGQFAISYVRAQEKCRPQR